MFTRFGLCISFVTVKPIFFSRHFSNFKFFLNENIPTTTKKSIQTNNYSLVDKKCYFDNFGFKK